MRGQGVWLYDAAGTPWLDAYNNVACVGHSHPQVVEAIARQAATLNTHTRYLHEGILAYAERLLATLPDALGHAMFTCTCTGSEANDLALRIATAHTGATGLIITRYAYHGVTAALACASPSLGEYVRLVDPPAGGDAQTAHRFAQGVRAAIADLQAHGMQPAALLVDTVFSSDGVFISDEVQPGFGRTGEAFWGFVRHGVVPDIVTMGKPMGNGHPVAGLAVRPGVIQAFGQASRYFNTFGGSPVSMAAASAVLDVLEQDRLQHNALQVGQYLSERLVALAQRHPQIGEVRGAGLFIGVDLVEPLTRAPAAALASQVVNGLRRRQVLLSATGPQAHVLKIRPPLVFQREHADWLVDRLDAVLTGLKPGQ